MPQLSALARREAGLLLALLVWLAAVLVGPPLLQPASYHHFADTRTLLGVPNALDVLSNGAFAVVAAALVHAARRARRALSRTEIGLTALLAGGLLATALGSGFYHLRPDEAGLLVDRLGMALAFGGVIGLAAAERFPARSALALAAATVAAGTLTAQIAYASSDIWGWSLVQAGGALFIAATLLLPVQRAALGVRWWPLLAAYGLAKVLEAGDAPVLALTGGLVAGHSLKHLVAAAAIWPIAAALHRAAAKPR